MYKVLTRKFYERDPEQVAKELLGKVIVRQIGKEILKGRIVECEAYLAAGDEAAHNYRGRDERNESMYKTGGHIYVHESRHHTLMDIVTESEDEPSAVLIRAIEPIAGIETMKKIRGVDALVNLANGPGKFCQAFSITKDLDGLDITVAGSSLYVLDAPAVPTDGIGVSGRIGISRATEAQLRFWIRNNPYVSRKHVG